MTSQKSSKTDEVLDLLLDALAERQEARRADQQPPPQPPPAMQIAPPTAAKKPLPEAEKPAVAETAVAPIPPAPPEAPEPAAPLGKPAPKQPSTGPEPPVRLAPLPSIQVDVMLRRLAIGVVLLIILINIPINRNGLSLARAMPDARSLIIRDGLVLKGSSEKIYVLENNQKRWISTLDAFTFHGYRWEQVNQVDDAFLNRFADGPPIYVLLKCQESPHIYALEDGQKRWIKNIPTFEREGFLWEDVKFVSCAELRRLPTGVPIPPDAGPSPEP